MINNREDLKNYCLRKLGAPVLRINISNDQLEDALDDGLQMFFQYHFDGQVEQYLAHILTEDEITSGEITLDDNIVSVNKITFNSGNMTSIATVSTADVQMQSYFSDVIKSLTTNGVSSFFMINSQMAEINNAFKWYNHTSFNYSRRKLYILTSLKSLKAGDAIIIHCYTRTSPDDFPKVYDELWLKKYITALFKRQWYTNLSKYSNVPLIGGTVLDVQGQISTVNDEIDKLEQSLRFEFEYPPMFFMG